MQKITVIASAEQQVLGATEVPGLLRHRVFRNDRLLLSLQAQQRNPVQAAIFAMIKASLRPRCIPRPAPRIPLFEDIPVPAFAWNQQGTPRDSRAAGHRE